MQHLAFFIVITGAWRLFWYLQEHLGVSPDLSKYFPVLHFEHVVALVQAEQELMHAKTKITFLINIAKITNCPVLVSNHQMLC